MWFFLGCQSLYIHHLISYQVFWNKILKKKTSAAKLTYLFHRKWPNYTWPIQRWRGWLCIEKTTIMIIISGWQSKITMIYEHFFYFCCLVTGFHFQKISHFSYSFHANVTYIVISKVRWSMVYYTYTKFHYLFNLTTDPEDVLNLICLKYYKICINEIDTSVKLNFHKYFKIYF